MRLAQLLEIVVCSTARGGFRLGNLRGQVDSLHARTHPYRPCQNRLPVQISGEQAERSFDQEQWNCRWHQLVVIPSDEIVTWPKGASMFSWVSRNPTSRP